MTIRRSSLCTAGLVVAMAIAFSHDSIAGINRWTSTGPNGGMFTSFFFHPTKKNLIFASGWGSACLYRSHDGGRSWERMIEDCVFAKIHLSEPDVIIGGRYSIYRSTDEGDSWQLLADGPFKEPMSDLEFHPKNPLILYALTDSSKVYKSTDGARTWTNLSKGLPDGCLYGSLEVDPTNGNIVYVNLSNGRIYKTTNGATSWKEASKGLALDWGSANALAIDPRNPSVLYAGGHPIFKTVNGGKQWTRIADDLYWNNIAVDPNNVQNVYGAGNGLWRSTDGGSTWTNFDLDTESFLGVAVHPASSKIIFAGGYGQGIYRSQDAGKTWSSQNSGLDAVSVVGLSAQPGRSGHLFCTTTPPFESRDKGKTWQLMEISRAPHSNWITRDILVHPARPDLVVAAVAHSEGAILVSTDGLKTWKHKSPYTDVRRIALDPTNQRTIYAAPVLSGQSPYLGMAKSADLGDTWKMINRGFKLESVESIAVDPRNGSRLLIGTDSGKVYWSSDGGEKWNRATIDSEGRQVSAFAFDPTDSRKIWLASWNGTMKSTDSGKTWKQMLPGCSDFVTIDPADRRTILVGNGAGGLFMSTDDGQNWSAYDSTGLPLCIPLSFLFSPWDPDTIFMGTSRGVFSYTKKVTPEAPRIDQLIPAAGKVGDAITINGSGFGQYQGGSAVDFGSVDAGIAQSWSEASIKVTVPSGVPTGSVTVTVLNKKSNPFEFIVLPASGNIEPTSGPAAGGTRVTILAPSGTSGTQFNVLFGSALASNIRFMQPNMITCESPAGAGTVEVKVTSSVTSTTVGTFSYY